MERMGVEYQRFDGKEYVSLRRYYNLLCKCKALEKENKKLKEENDRLKDNAMEDMRVQTKLEEKTRFLEECLDNKEKVNRKLREELSAYDREFRDEDKKAKNIYKSQKENILMGKI